MLKSNFWLNSTSGPLTPNIWGKWTTQRYSKITCLVFILKYFKQFEIIAANQMHHLGVNYLKHTISGLQ